MAGPMAYFLTWTTYGAWLHGDARGSVDATHNLVGKPRARARAGRVRVMQSRMRSASVVLDAAQRAIVEEAVRAHCEHRSWWLGAVSVRSNHVHVVVHGLEAAPEQVAGQLKAWATRRLREAGAFGPTDRIWTREGSTRYLWTERDVQSAQQYVLECQDIPHKQRAPDAQ